jgi:hypothetical protein
MAGMLANSGGGKQPLIELGVPVLELVHLMGASTIDRAAIKSAEETASACCALRHIARRARVRPGAHRSSPIPGRYAFVQPSMALATI